jgi:hypothetical protein
MLAGLKNVLLNARARHYAVFAFDCVEDILIRTILDTTEANKSPVILMVLEHDLKGRGIDYIASMVKGVAGKYMLNTVGRNARAVAEFTVGMILSEVRNIARSHTALRRGVWMKPNSQAVPEICHKAVGLLASGMWVGCSQGTFMPSAVM